MHGTRTTPKDTRTVMVAPSSDIHEPMLPMIVRGGSLTGAQPRTTGCRIEDGP